MIYFQIVSNVWGWVGVDIKSNLVLNVGVEALILKPWTYVGKILSVYVFIQTQNYS